MAASICSQGHEWANIEGQHRQPCMGMRVNGRCMATDVRRQLRDLLTWFGRGSTGVGLGGLSCSAHKWHGAPIGMASADGYVPCMRRLRQAAAACRTACWQIPHPKHCHQTVWRSAASVVMGTVAIPTADCFYCGSYQPLVMFPRIVSWCSPCLGPTCSICETCAPAQSQYEC